VSWSMAHCGARNDGMQTVSLQKCIQTVHLLIESLPDSAGRLHRAFTFAIYYRPSVCLSVVCL